ncbi:hypothetical protein FUT69_03715 [Xylella taiwanensis]|nr:hypothetical protein [Xylella taiwanensis]
MTDQLAKRADVSQVKQITTGSKNTGWDKAVNGSLEPKTAYVLDNGHGYVTDTAGRVKNVQADLTSKKMDRNTYQQRCMGKCGELGDEGGHLIASSLGGAGDRINLVPQAEILNRSGWRKMEQQFNQALQDGKSVSVKIDLGYPATGGVRPNKFVVEATIDGEKILKEFYQ